MWPRGVSHESMHISEVSKIIEPNVLLSTFQRMESERQWVEGVWGGTGKNYRWSDVILRNKQGGKCFTTWGMWSFGLPRKPADVRNWWAGFHNRGRASDETPAGGGAATGVHVCECHGVHMWHSVCVCVFEIKFFSGWRRGEQLSPLLITSQQKQEWPTEQREGQGWFTDNLLVSLIWSIMSQQVSTGRG